jgi:ribosomal protein S18 acetylase RimI-like enzyme
MFCPPDLAARIDQAEARQMIAIATGAGAADPGLAPFIVPVGAGAAIFAGDGSPTNKMIGIGFAEALDDAVLDDVEARFAARGSRLQAEVSVLAEPATHARLAARGYVPSGFEHVLGYPVGGTIPPLPEGVQVETIAASEIEALGDVMVTAFANPDVGGVGGDLPPPDEEVRKWFGITMRVDGFRGYFARVGGEIAGGASLRFDGDVAQFSGAGTLPRFRRRGVQTALLRARLADAARAGCTVAVVVVQPGSKSQQNAQRAGFGLLYGRQLMVKPAPSAA